MQRVGFRLQVRPELMDEYVKCHTEVWPDMLQALRETCWTNYSLFLDRTDGTLFGYFETPDLEAAKLGMTKREVNDKWQEAMAPFFINLEGKQPGQDFLRLEEVFYLK